MKTFTACLWETTSLGRDSLEDFRHVVWTTHARAGVVETCQRIEAYSLQACECPAPRKLTGWAAASHLASLAAGLESAALGEYQVLGQVRSGIAPLRSSAPWLDGVIAAARSLRAEAGFAAGTGHLLDAALELSGCKSRGSLLVVGAGAAGRDVARRALNLGFARVALASRRQWVAEGIEWLPFDCMAAQTRQDVVVTCVGSGAGELSADRLPEAGLYIDLGAPPNLAADVAPAVSLHAIIQAVREDEGDRARRAALRRRLSELLSERLTAKDDGLSPVGRMRREAEVIRAREADRIARLHPALPRQTIDTITRSLVNQLLHVPSERLRTIDDPALATRLAELFLPTEALS